MNLNTTEPDNSIRPTRSADVVHYGTPLVCVNQEVDPDDDGLFRVTLVQADSAEDEVDLTASRIVFSGPTEAVVQFHIGSRHYLSADIETTL